MTTRTVEIRRRAAPPTVDPSLGVLRADAQRELLETRARSFRIRQMAHSFGSERYCKRGRWLGLAVVVLTTIVGTGAFISLQNDPSTYAKVIVTVLSITAAVAAALKEYAGYEDLSKRHGSAATEYQKLRYGTEELLEELLDGASPEDLRERLGKLDERAGTLTAETIPVLPGGLYRKAERWVDEQRLRTSAGVSSGF